NMARIPDVDGLQFEYACEMIEQEGFVVELQYEHSETVGISNVIRTEPANGEMAETGAIITVFVNASQDQADLTDVEDEAVSDLIIVPNLVGLSIEQAKMICESSNIAVEAISVPSNEPEGIVVAQSLMPGVCAAADSIVIINYSDGKSISN
ncbi:MAG: PASTA domain-containing protein, partial [Lachnospiraceae bacterium]|nr:PASTA domain-containing protein [Lachnospiraceae bacterium]